MARTAASTSSTEKPTGGPGAEARPVEIGRVVGAHGLRGQLRIRTFGDGPDALLEIERVTLVASPERADAYAVTRIAPGRRGELRVALDGVTRRDDAEALVGRIVQVEAGQLAELPAGEFYAHQLVGCRLEGADGTVVGTVRGIWQTGAHDVLVVESDAGVERLVPAAEELLREVDLPGRRIVVEIPPGLLDGE